MDRDGQCLNTALLAGTEISGDLASLHSLFLYRRLIWNIPTAMGPAFALG